MKPSPVFLHRPSKRCAFLHDGPPPAWDRLKSRTQPPKLQLLRLAGMEEAAVPRAGGDPISA